MKQSHYDVVNGHIREPTVSKARLRLQNDSLLGFFFPYWSVGLRQLRSEEKKKKKNFWRHEQSALQLLNLGKSNDFTGVKSRI